MLCCPYQVRTANVVNQWSAWPNSATGRAMSCWVAANFLEITGYSMYFGSHIMIGLKINNPEPCRIAEQSQKPTKREVQPPRRSGPDNDQERCSTSGIQREHDSHTGPDRR